MYFLSICYKLNSPNKYVDFVQPLFTYFMVYLDNIFGVFWCP